MEKMKRSERLGAIAGILIKTPNQIHTLGEFCALFGAAKSTVSEDIDLIANSLRECGCGIVETVAGAAGGVRFRPVPGKPETSRFLQELCGRLSDTGRILPGGFLYTSDITADPQIAQRIGEILAADYYRKTPDFVLTMETKGIPIAMMTARILNVPLVIARRETGAYEGSAVKINYISGGRNERIETMALPRRAAKPGQKALIIDDFMKGGGTLRGMVDLMHEFEVEVIGICVLIATAEPERKNVQNVQALLKMKGIDQERGCAIIEPCIAECI